MALVATLVVLWAFYRRQVPASYPTLELEAPGTATYLFSPQYGSLTIDNTSFANAGPMDQLDLGHGMDQTDTWFARSGDDLTVQVMGTNGVVDI